MSPLVRLLAALAGVAAAPLAPARDAASDLERPISDEDRRHWAFRPLARPLLPAVRDASWPQDPIDAFVLARLEEEALRPQPEAPRAVLARRLAFDLTGLPLPAEDVDAFLLDRSPDALDRFADRLLASPAYGERWAQHWLDLARFAETDGFEHDHVRPNAWRYRDWVIGALNADLPYDDFVRLQLAGDELLPQDTAAAVATGFVLAGPDMPDLNRADERRHMVLNELTATVGAVFLGLQVGCAQCHDHKFDPLSSADFYRLRAVFEPGLQLAELPLLSQTNAAGAAVAASAPVEPAAAAEATPRAGAAQPEKPQGPMGRVMREQGPWERASHLMVRGSFQRPGPEVRPGVPRIADPWEAELLPEPSGPAASGRRRALADWLVRSDNPLATRVIANRVWQHHFGRGLVDTPSDFGLMGGAPSHPELLDYLATELGRLGWSLKRLHRRLASSSAYRQSSRIEVEGLGAAEADSRRSDWEASLDRDASGRLLSRAPRRRLDAESVRDSVLEVSGLLVRKAGGPGVQPPLPPEVLKTLLKGQWKASESQEDHYRRSVYLFVRRNLRFPFLEVFDRPDAQASCAARSRSTTAPQALALLNDEVLLVASRRLAGRVLRGEGCGDGEDASAGATVRTAMPPGSPTEIVRRAFRLAVGREPSTEELRDALDFLERQERLLQGESRRPEDLALPLPTAAGLEPEAAAALTDLCLVLFNLSEFLYVD